MGDYNVVFEYTEKAGGYYGNRTWTSYNSKKEFETTWTSTRSQNGLEVIVAQGVSDKEAVNITSLTPEFCRITAAIQESTNQDQILDKNIFEFQLTTNVFAIEHDRELVEDNPELKRHTIGKILEFWVEKTKNEEGLKSELIKATIEASNIYGQVHIGSIEASFMLACVLY